MSDDKLLELLRFANEGQSHGLTKGDVQDLFRIHDQQLADRDATAGMLRRLLTQAQPYVGMASHSLSAEPQAVANDLLSSIDAALYQGVPEVTILNEVKPHR